MFTGIVQGYCSVTHMDHVGGVLRLTMGLESLAEGLELGASVAVNGTCLTVSRLQGGSVTFDVIAETLSTTNLGALEVGSQANVERSFRVGDEVGGHILSGHVAGKARVVDIHEREGERDITFAVGAQWTKYLAHKGFVALDGASITIAAVDREAARFKVCLIPETIARTTLGRCVVGSEINLEVDAQTQSVVDTVERMLSDDDWSQWRQELLSPERRSATSDD